MKRRGEEKKGTESEGGIMDKKSTPMTGEGRVLLDG